MDKKGSGAAWAVAGLAIVALIGSLVWAFSLQQHVQSLKQAVTDSQQQAQALKDQAQRQDEQVRRLEETVGQFEQRLAAVSTPENPTAPAPGDAAAPDEQAAESQKPAQEANPMVNMFKMFEGEQGKKFAEASADAAMAMQFGDLFTMLALPPESEQKVRSILRDYMVRGMTEGAKFMKGGLTPDSAKKFEDNVEADLRKELSKVLTSEGMAIYDEYEQGMPERMLRKSFEMQMGMFAPSLAEETRTMVIDVMVEEMMSIKEEPGSLAMMTDPAAAQTQLDALERSRLRLVTVLDEQQMTQVDGFIQQQRMGLEMFQQMMSSQNKPKTEN